MPGLQVVDLSPIPRQENTLEKTLGSFTSRFRENQIQERESDALRDIYSQYQQDGQNLEKTIQDIQTRPGISPTSRVNTINQLLQFQKHNTELQKKAKQDASNKSKVADLEQRRNLTPGSLAAYEDDPKMAEQVTRPEKVKPQNKQEEKRKLDDEQKVRNFETALQRLDRMDKIRSKKNIGRGSAIPGFFGGETARDRAEYSRLGKSLISFASTIPIRNQMEFETLAHDLHDPNLTLSEMEGIIKGMKMILMDSIRTINPEYNQNISDESTVKERPPLTSFKR